MHPLCAWLSAHYADGPLATFAKMYADVLPADGTLDDLRTALVDHLRSTHTDSQIIREVFCLEVAWDKYAPPCTVRDCPALALPDSLRCEGHTLERLL